MLPTECHSERRLSGTPLAGTYSCNHRSAVIQGERLTIRGGICTVLPARVLGLVIARKRSLPPLAIDGDTGNRMRVRCTAARSASASSARQIHIRLNVGGGVSAASCLRGVVCGGSIAVPAIL